jgi:hypothetical protein
MNTIATVLFKLNDQDCSAVLSGDERWAVYGTPAAKEIAKMLNRLFNPAADRAGPSEGIPQSRAIRGAAALLDGKVEFPERPEPEEERVY